MLDLALPNWYKKEKPLIKRAQFLNLRKYNYLPIRFNTLTKCFKTLTIEFPKKLIVSVVL